MKRVYISQPMNGLSDDEIFAARDAAIAKLKETYGEVEVIDTFVHDDPPEGVNVSLWYFVHSIEHMVDADIVCFIGEWENARGCLLEYMVAAAYGVETLDMAASN